MQASGRETAIEQEDVDGKFRRAWDRFCRSCAETVVNEPTYQVWFAHYLIAEFGIERVLREPDFGPRHFVTPEHPFSSKTSVRTDVVVARTPGVAMPHRRYRPYVTSEFNDGGIAVLSDLCVIAELKVSGTQGEGLDYGEVILDVQKLSLLLDEADHHGINPPLAYACVLDNGRGRHAERAAGSFNVSHFQRRLARVKADPRVHLLLRPGGASVSSPGSAPRAE